MKTSAMRIFIGLSLCLLLSIPASAANNTVIARIDLQDHEDFLAAKALKIQPFFRLENVFFAELTITEISAMRNAGIPFEIVDDHPFSSPYYLGSIETIVSRKIPVAGFERLGEVGRQALYKAAGPVDYGLYRQSGFNPVEIKKRELPLTWFAPSVSSPAPRLSASDPIMDAVVAAVILDSIYSYNTRLENFRTRLTLSDSNRAARDWLVSKFTDFGYTEISLLDFWCGDNRYGASGTAYNVVCVKEGTVEPDKVIVIGGHFDSIVYDGNDPWVYAPGSDDNGSGTVGILEIARVLADVPTKKTIIFVPFDSEENGLVGSWYFADYLSYIGADVELMLNMDMIGFTQDDYPNINCGYYNTSRPYLELMADLANQYTGLYPEVVPAGSGSDHVPFHEYGFVTAYIDESDFNWDGWHTELDLTSRMNFPYMTEVIKMAAGLVYAVSAYPSTIDDAVAFDVGDGQSLQLQWPALADPEITGYQVYWGFTTGVYPYSQFVPGGSSSNETIGGLTEGTKYYLTMTAIDEDGNESILRPEFTGTPWEIPRAPGMVTAETEEWQVTLSWAANRELDFSHYQIYRGTEPGVYSLLVDNYTGLDYSDTDVEAGVMYEYVITAVDLDGNVSENSEPVNAAAATFDQGILIINTTPPGAGNPTAEQMQAFLAAAFDGYETSYYFYDHLVAPLSKSIIGQYEAIFWIGDHNAGRAWDDVEIERLRWFLDHNTNMMQAGWRTAFEYAGLSSHQDLGPGNLLYDLAGINRVDEVFDVDYQGMIGEGAFPGAALDPDKVFAVWEGKMGWIGTLGTDGTGEIISRFDSESGAHTGEIIGVRRDNGGHKFVFLSTPFYYLKDADAHAVVEAVAEWFGIGVCDCGTIGDCVENGQIDAVDVVYLVNYVLRQTGPAPQSDPTCPVVNRGDFDCDGIVALSDVVKMVNFVYRYPAPGPCDPCGE